MLYSSEGLISAYGLVPSVFGCVDILFMQRERSSTLSSIYFLWRHSRFFGVIQKRQSDKTLKQRAFRHFLFCYTHPLAPRVVAQGCLIAHSLSQEKTHETRSDYRVR